MSETALVAEKTGCSVDAFALTLTLDQPVAALLSSARQQQTSWVAAFEDRIIHTLADCDRLLRWAIVSVDGENLTANLTIEGAYIKRQARERTGG